MTNFEFFRDEILKMANNDRIFALKKNKILKCVVMDCKKCDFGGGCISKRLRWLYAEHVDQPVLTSKEWHLLKALETGFIARDNDKTLWWHKEEPYKSEVGAWCSKKHIKIDFVCDILDFIKWEDPESYCVEEMLMWEHEEDN